MKKLNAKTGFTLAELLIVVAIIAIMVAIGIPAFSTAMERARETVDLSNIRGAYAEYMTGTMGGAANAGYYKVDVKQRDVSKWVIDCSGFMTNIVKANGDKVTAIDDMPKPSKTGVAWLYFYTNGSNEKPTLEFVADSSGKPTVTGKVPVDAKYAVATNGSVTNGCVSSGDGWYLCKSGA